MSRIGRRYRQEPLLYVVTVLAAVGVAAVLVGLMYSMVTASSLPFFVPGHTAGVHKVRAERGHAGLVLGVFVLIIAGVVATDLGKSRR